MKIDVVKIQIYGSKYGLVLILKNICFFFCIELVEIWRKKIWNSNKEINLNFDWRQKFRFIRSKTWKMKLLKKCIFLNAQNCSNYFEFVLCYRAKWKSVWKLIAKLRFSFFAFSKSNTSEEVCVTNFNIYEVPSNISRFLSRDELMYQISVFARQKDKNMNFVSIHFIFCKLITTAQKWSKTCAFRTVYTAVYFGQFRLFGLFSTNFGPILIQFL